MKGMLAASDPFEKANKIACVRRCIGLFIRVKVTKYSWCAKKKPMSH